MNLKSIIFTCLCLIITQLNAGTLYQFNNQPLTANRCDIIATNSALDLALFSDGYFAVSDGKKDSELLFTRFGQFALDRHEYIVNSSGFYLLGINKQSDPHLSKLKIPLDDMNPKATTKVKINVNLPASGSGKENIATTTTIYDNISGSHVFNIVYTQNEPNIWTAQVTIDDIKRDKGTLIFKSDGQISKQEGLSHIQWPTNNGLIEIKIDHTDSTQFSGPYTVQAILINGYPVGSIAGLNIGRDGNIILLYTNGQAKTLKNRIAVAKFTNPDYLENVISRLYRPTEKSGPARLHVINSEGAILSGYLEEEFCIAK